LLVGGQLVLLTPRKVGCNSKRCLHDD
jgi:hypothetical protein